MKIILQQLLLLFLVVVSPSVGTPVVDMFGNELLRESSYYIAPASSDSAGGGLTFDNTTGSCPLDVIQETVPWWYGSLWNFHPIHVDDPYVHTSSDLFINLDSTTHCPEKPMWTYRSNGAIQIAVRIALKGGLRGCNGAFSTYRIEAVNPPVYKITTSSVCGLQIYDVAVVNNQTRSQVFADKTGSNDAFLVKFTTFSPRRTVAAAA